MYGILIRNGLLQGEGKNLGDYMQSIAQCQFLRGKKTCYVEIEELSDFKSDEQVNVIMNGWFTWHPEKFLPPACINPLFISFHLTPPQEENFFTSEITSYLKAHEPIGARDIKTQEMMEKHGIKSYFSGCLTMTLGLEYKNPNNKHDGDIYIVDPYVEFGGDMSTHGVGKYLMAIWHAIRYFRQVCILYHKYTPDAGMLHSKFSKISRRLNKFVCLAEYYSIYSQRFSDEILLDAKYISAVIVNDKTNEEKFEMTEQMLKNFANAKCVITNRLHVSFPCLAVGTKNIFVIPSVKNEKKSTRKFCHERIMGLDDTINVMELENGKLVDKTTIFPSKITLSNFPDNKDGYLRYSEEMTKIVKDFVNAND